MANLYNVADRVEVVIEKEWKDPYTEETKQWTDHYAGTIITYHNFTDIDNKDNYLYKVSVDGLGDIVVCKESEIGGLILASPEERNM